MLESLDVKDIQKYLDESRAGFKLIVANRSKQTGSTYIIVDFNDGTFKLPICAKIRVSHHPPCHPQGKYFFVSLRHDLSLFENEIELHKLVCFVNQEINNLRIKYRSRLNQRF